MSRRESLRVERREAYTEFLDSVAQCAYAGLPVDFEEIAAAIQAAAGDQAATQAALESLEENLEATVSCSAPLRANLSKVYLVTEDEAIVDAGYALHNTSIANAT